MKTIQAAATVLLVGVMLAACSQQPMPANQLGTGTSSNAKFGDVEIRAGRVWLTANNGSKAMIDVNGDLEIDGKPIPLTDAQRALTQRYAKQTMLAGAQIAEVSAAGAAAADEIKDSFLRVIFNREPDQVEKKLDARFDKLDTLASKLCDRARELNSTQDAIVDSIPAFAPFATTNKCLQLKFDTRATDGNAE